MSDEEVTVSTVEAELARAVESAARICEKLRRFQSRAMAIAYQRAKKERVPLEEVVRLIRAHADAASETAATLHGVARRIGIIAGHV
jgi:hypothetical protein